MQKHLIAIATLMGVLVGLAFPSAGFAQQSADNTPDTPKRLIIKFATTTDYPPFNARDDDGVMVGFNVDLARALCFELEVTCEIVPLAWNALLPALARRRVDAVIAAHRINVDTLAQADFSDPYFHTPGRFAARRDGPKLSITPNGLDRKKIGVAKGTSHEAFIQTFFRTSQIERFATPEAARQALRDKKVDLIFGDGIGLVFWINGSLSGGCCDLTGGAYLEPLFFGDGIGIAVRRGDRDLRLDLNSGLTQLRANGRMLELMQRYFPRKVF